MKNAIGKENNCERNWGITETGCRIRRERLRAVQASERTREMGRNRGGMTGQWSSGQLYLRLGAQATTKAVTRAGTVEDSVGISCPWWVWMGGGARKWATAS